MNGVRSEIPCRFVAVEQSLVAAWRHSGTLSHHPATDRGATGPRRRSQFAQSALGAGTATCRAC